MTRYLSCANLAPFVWWLVFHDGEVCLAELTFLDFYRHAAQGLACLGKDDSAADRSVDAMYQTREYVARFVVSFFDIRFHVIEKTNIASLVALDYLGRQFVDNNEMIVFKQYTFFYWFSHINIARFR